jgi:hypothetical protein
MGSFGGCCRCHRNPHTELACDGWPPQIRLYSRPARDLCFCPGSCQVKHFGIWCFSYYLVPGETEKMSDLWKEIPDLILHGDALIGGTKTISDARKEVSDLILHGDGIDRSKWLAQEVGDLARRIPNLDEFSPKAVRPLAKLVADGETDANTLALALDIEEAQLEMYLDALCEFNFAEREGAVYKATPAGVQAFDAIGQRMVARELMGLPTWLEKLKRLRTFFNGA